MPPVNPASLDKQVAELEQHNARLAAELAAMRLQAQQLRALAASSVPS